MRARNHWTIACMGVVLSLCCSACSQRWAVAPGHEHCQTNRQWRAEPQTPSDEPAAAREVQVQLEESTAACDDCPRTCRHSLCCRLDSILCEAKHDVADDYRNFYSCPTARGLLWGIAGASVLANTALDQDFRDWVQDDARSKESDHFGDFWKSFGHGDVFIPSYAGLALAGKLLEDVPVCGVAGEFGMRTTRAYLVGAPPMALMQYGLGGSRPGERDDASFWRPFNDDNAASGHAFVGAVPFLTAARMTEDPCVKACWYAMSVLPAWSRVNDDSHYLSQVGLGWWMAYLACESVDRTETAAGWITVTPIARPGMVGIGIVCER
jgi:hypothetical protein